MGKGRASVLLTGKMKSWLFLVMCHDQSYPININECERGFILVSIGGWNLSCHLSQRAREREQGCIWHSANSLFAIVKICAVAIYHRSGGFPIWNNQFGILTNNLEF